MARFLLLAFILILISSSLLGLALSKTLKRDGNSQIASLSLSLFLVLD
jgi:hypothetical protein